MIAINKAIGVGIKHPYPKVRLYTPDYGVKRIVLEVYQLGFGGGVTPIRKALDIHDALRLAGHLDNLGMESPNSIGDVDFFLDQLTVKGHAARIDTEESKQLAGVLYHWAGAWMIGTRLQTVHTLDLEDCHLARLV